MVASVSNTKIFARSSLNGRQFLVYSMSYEAESDLAMILPLPTPTNVSEEAVRFLDMSAYAEFFTDLYKPFITRSATFSLMVHDVGSFEASFVPQKADFSRLDPRFQLDDTVWAKLPQYDDYGFAVFKLKPGAKAIHPLALEFPRRHTRQLFFPTIHVHHGRVDPFAEFHHLLYCQSQTPFVAWRDSDLDAGQYIDIDRAAGIVAPELKIQMWSLFGIYENKDIVLQE